MVVLSPVVWVKRALSNQEDYAANAPILINSIPKSGTHLLAQILQAIPGITSYGRLFATIPSFPHRVVPSHRMKAKLNSIVPGELIKGHIHFDAGIRDVINHTHACHFFICRDPRDVVVSEVHYLLEHARWHGMHPYFRSLPDHDARIAFCITGVYKGKSIPEYPNIEIRLESYLAWEQQPEVCAVRFEDLLGLQQAETFDRIFEHVQACPGAQLDRDTILKGMYSSMHSQRAHTFRKGSVGQWAQEFSQGNKALFKQTAGDLLIQLGYETDLNW